MMLWRSRPAIALTAAGMAAALAAAVAPTPRAAAAVQWRLAWSTTFQVSAKLGSFSWCDHDAGTSQAYCAGLPAVLRHQWWAYPRGWPDTASERHYLIGGYYDPATTLWISDRMLHIRLWRATGPVHSAAVVPKAAAAVRYGKFVERWRVVKATRGYKSAHLLWPQQPGPAEVDFPEDDWDTSPAAYVHYGPGDHQISFASQARWNSWHTSTLTWMPGQLMFYLDGRLIGSTRTGVPQVPMAWILQNETSLDGEIPPPNSSAQMDISYVAVYRLA